MVNVSGVIKGFEVNIAGRVPIPVQWLLCHCRLNNLYLTRDINEMLVSKQVSERIVGDILIAYDTGNHLDLSQYSWLFYNTKKRLVEGMYLPEASNDMYHFINGDNWRNVFAAPMKLVEGKVRHNFLNAPGEREYNEDILRHYCKGLPVNVYKLSPIKGPITLSSVRIKDMGRTDYVDSGKSPKPKRLFGSNANDSL